jgi:hypothetical protein
VDALQAQAKILSNLKAPTCRLVMVLTGLIAAFNKAVLLLRLRGIWLQMSLNEVYSSEADLQKTMTLWPRETYNGSSVYHHISASPLFGACPQKPST